MPEEEEQEEEEEVGEEEEPLEEEEELENFADLPFYPILKVDKLILNELLERTRIRAFIGAPNQTIGSAAYTKVEFDYEDYDEHGEYDHTTNYRFTVTRAGYYFISAELDWSGVTVNQSLKRTCIYKNGTNIREKDFRDAGTQYQGTSIRDVLYLEVGDYIEIYCYQDSGNNQDLYSGAAAGKQYNWLNIYQLN